MESEKLTNKKDHRVKKTFIGSKPSEFYDEKYFLEGGGSNYGRKDAQGTMVYAPYEESVYLPRNRELAKFIVDVYKPKTALILGCARGYLVQALHEQGVDCKGIDISEWAITNAPSKIKEHLVVGDICDLSQFKTGEFDLVTAFDVFEHITVPDLYTALNEASRVCKDTLIIDVPIEKDDLHPDQSAGADKSHVSVYSEQFWTRQFTNYMKDGVDYVGRGFKLDGKEVYTYPEGNQGATIILRKNSVVMHSCVRPKILWHSDAGSKITGYAKNGGIHSGDLNLCFLPKDVSVKGEIKGDVKQSSGDITLTFPPISREKQSITIILLNYNGLKFTPKCIETLYKNTDYPFKLIVVDNQSTDGSQDWLKFAQRSYPHITVVFCGQLNEGFADGVNIGLTHLKAQDKISERSPYVLLLNNDTIFLQKNWLSLMVEALEKDFSNGIVSPKLLYPNGSIQYAGASFTPDLQPYHFGRFKKADSFNVEREIPWATFACALIRRELLKDGLDPAYKLGTFEDVDFCTKARFNGYKIIYAPQSQVYHYEGATVFTVNKTHYQQQQQANGNLFYSRWAQWLRMNRNAYPTLYKEDA